MQRQLLLWICGIVTVALTMSRHWVICRHHDGDAHLEINHAEGDHFGDHEARGRGHDGHEPNPTCDCGHHHPHAPGGSPNGSSGCDPHDSCSHTDLLVEIGPEQEPDSVYVPKLLAFELPRSTAAQRCWTSTKKHVLAPPATGPPRPRRFWSLRRTTLLLI